MEVVDFGFHFPDRIPKLKYKFYFEVGLDEGDITILLYCLDYNGGRVSFDVGFKLFGDLILQTRATPRENSSDCAFVLTEQLLLDILVCCGIIYVEHDNLADMYFPRLSLS